MRLAEGEVTKGECTWLRVGDFRCPMPGEPSWLILMVRSDGRRPRPLLGAGCTAPGVALDAGARGMWLSRAVPTPPMGMEPWSGLNMSWALPKS